MADSPNTFMLLLRLGMSLGMVLAIVGAVTWVLRRRGLLRPSAAGEAPARLQVVDRKSLGKRASIVVASVGEVTVMLGVTDQQVNVLATAPGAGGTWVTAPAATDATVAHAPAATAALAATAPDTTAADTTAGDTTAPALDATVVASQPVRPATRCSTAPSARATGMTMGTRRTGTRVQAPSAGTEPTGMSFVDALRELTVRKS
ncbi:MAG: flagellar biosynthetic protein FliO [Actinomycetota bacterium]|nr:flagellar biosynthetic protein FliO [Actinomycetota bacterium]